MLKDLAKRRGNKLENMLSNDSLCTYQDTEYPLYNPTNL